METTPSAMPATMRSCVFSRKALNEMVIDSLPALAAGFRFVFLFIFRYYL